jgi:retron-type reverse transcriptase
VKFIEHRIGDRRIIGLIQKWLKAGVLEEGQWTQNEEGTPQGGYAKLCISRLGLSATRRQTRTPL